MQDITVMEIQGYFYHEVARLKEELTAKEEEYRKAVGQLRNLPFASHLERFLKPFLNWLLPRKVKRLKTEAVELQEKVNQYQQAETELAEGKYGLAWTLLHELVDRFFYSTATPVPSPSFDISGGTGTTLLPGSMFFQIAELENALAVRMRGKNGEAAMSS